MFIQQETRRTFAELAGRPNQNVSDTASPSLSERTCRSFPERKLSTVAREWRFWRLLHRFCATNESAGGRHHCSATLIANRVSAHRRSLERYDDRIARRFSS